MPVGGGRRTDTDKGNLGLEDSLSGVLRSANPPLGVFLGEDSVDVLFNDGGPAPVDEVHLGGLRVHTDHAMTLLCQTPHADTAHVAESKNTDIHRSMVVLTAIFRAPRRVGGTPVSWSFT